MIRFDDFAEALGRTATLQVAQAELQRSVERLGYVSLDYGVAALKTPAPRSTDDFELLLYMATFGWTDRYVELGYKENDRITRSLLGRVTPVPYWDQWRLPYETAIQRQMENEIREQGVGSGLAIPLHAPGGRFGALELGSSLGREEFERLDRETRPVAMLMAAYFHDHVRRLVPGLEPQAPVALSARERECLAWAARGKTAWETSMILSLSERTVKKHVAAAAEKLGARTRAQAVAAAVRQGLIQL